MLSHPLWFWFLRSRYRGTPAHDARNRALEAAGLRRIHGQRTCPDFHVGTQHMGRVGCEVAATFNALRLCGYAVSCADIIRDFEGNGYLMGAFTVGDFGTDPYALGEYFQRKRVKHRHLRSYAEMEREADGSRGEQGVFIVSFWNRPRIWGGLHTVAFYTAEADRLLHVLNFYGNARSETEAPSFSALTDQKRFITGWRVTLPRVGCGEAAEMLSCFRKGEDAQ